MRPVEELGVDGVISLGLEPCERLVPRAWSGGPLREEFALREIAE